MFLVACTPKMVRVQRKWAEHVPTICQSLKTFYSKSKKGNGTSPLFGPLHAHQRRWERKGSGQNTCLLSVKRLKLFIPSLKKGNGTSPLFGPLSRSLVSSIVFLLVFVAKRFPVVNRQMFCLCIGVLRLLSAMKYNKYHSCTCSYKTCVRWPRAPRG